MRLVKRSPWLMGLGVLLAGLVTAPGARGDVTSDESGTLIIFPKVVSDGMRDTLIQLSNRTNSFIQVHCFYINASGACSLTTSQSCEIDSDCPTGEQCIRQCNATNFELALTAQQPVQWRVSTGRLTTIPSAPCRPGQNCQCTVDSSGQLVCPGLLIGQNQSSFVPPVGTQFVGELKCYQMNVDGDPFPGNALKGTATIEDLSSAQISEYNALTVAANADTAGGGLNTDKELRLNWTGTGAGELNYCPASLVFTANAEGVTDAFTGATISTELTLVPCSELIEENLPAPVRVRFQGFNEFEQPLSIEAFSFDCFLNRRLADLPVSNGGVFVNGNQDLWKIRISPRPVNVCYSGSNRGNPCTQDSDCPGALTGPANTLLGCLPASGVLGVAEEFYTSGGSVGTAAFNLRHEGSRSGFGDIITLP